MPPMSPNFPTLFCTVVLSIQLSSSQNVIIQRVLKRFPPGSRLCKELRWRVLGPSLWHIPIAMIGFGTRFLHQSVFLIPKKQTVSNLSTLLPSAEGAPTMGKDTTGVGQVMLRPSPFEEMLWFASSCYCQLNLITFMLWFSWGHFFFVNREKEHGFLSRVVTERVVVIYGSWWVGMCIVHTFSFPAVHFIIDVCSGLYYKNEFGDDFSVLFWHPRGLNKIY